MKRNYILILVTVISLISISGIVTMAATGNRDTRGNIAIDEGYKQTNLVSDIPGNAQITDPNLVNSWGLARSQTGEWFVADNGMGISTTYKEANGKIKILPLKITIPALNGNSASSPTGIVFNSGKDFNIGNVATDNIGNAAIDSNIGNVANNIPARYIFVTEDGTISGWNKKADPNNAMQKVNNAPEAVYKGVTIAKNGDQNLLYVANFRGGSVDVFDTNFGAVNMAVDSFKDSDIPTGFAPFNVQNINGKIYVSYAQQDDAKHDNLDGPGLGYADVFNPDGTLDKRLEHGSWMNAPWGITMAPNNFGKVSNDILIGNFGSGNIAAFDPKTGKFKGLLSDSNGLITIDGLWGIKFGNGGLAGPANTLFFSAGIDGEAHGLFGTITTEERIRDRHRN